MKVSKSRKRSKGEFCLALKRLAASSAMPQSFLHFPCLNRNWKKSQIAAWRFKPNVISCCRIVNVSSMAHYQGRIYWRDVHFEKKNNKYDRIKAYTQSKLANVMHARELALRLEGSGIRVVSLHPGASIFCHMYLYLPHYIIFHLSTFLMGSCSFNWRSTPFYNFGTW